MAPPCCACTDVCCPGLPPRPLCSKRPRRAASGGVLGAVAAEASHWGLEMVSPPLKRANSLPVSRKPDAHVQLPVAQALQCLRALLSA